MKTKIFSLNYKTLLFIGIFVLCFSVYFSVSFYASKINIQISEDIKIKDFPILENTDKMIFLVEKLKETFQAAVATNEEDELDSATETSEKIKSFFNNIIEADPKLKEDVAGLQTIFEKYFKDSYDISLKLIEGELDFSNAGPQLEALTDTINKFETNLKEFRDNKYVRFTLAVKKSQDTAIQSQKMGLAILIVCLLISGILMMIVKRIVVRPIVKLAHSSQEVANGKFEPAEIGKSNDEIGVLGNNFNLMINEIKQNNERLEFIHDKSGEISASYSFQIFYQRIMDSFSVLLQRVPELSIYLADTCYMNNEIEPGWYQIADNGEPILETRIPKDVESLYGPKTVVAKDPRTSEVLSVIVIERPEEVDDSSMQVLNALSNSLANALATIRLEKAKVLIEMKSRDMKTIFSNITQGICTIDNAMNLGSEYSEFLHEIVGEEDLAGKSLFDLIIKHSTLGQESKDMIKEIIFCSVDENLLGFEANSVHLPSELEMVKGDKTTQLELDWYPLANSDEEIEKMMVTVRDVTALKELSKLAEKSRELSEKIMQILGGDRENYIKTMLNAAMLLDRVDQTLEEDNMTYEQAKLIKADLHTLKGNSRILNLSYLSEAIHEIETDFFKITNEMGDGSTVSKSAYKHIKLDQVRATYQDYISISRDKLAISFEDEIQSENGSGSKASGLSTLIEKLKSSSSEQNIQEVIEALTLIDKKAVTVQNFFEEILNASKHIAEKEGVKVPTFDLNLETVYFEGANLTPLNNAFHHLVSNTYAHGFTKESNNQISISAKLEGDHYKIIYKDNGKGLNLPKIRDIAKERLKKEFADDVSLANTIFESEFSTSADQVTEMAGRGMGMYIVKDSIESLGGTVEIKIGEVSDFGPEFKRIQFEVVLPKSAVHVI